MRSAADQKSLNLNLGMSVRRCVSAFHRQAAQAVLLDGRECTRHPRSALSAAVL